MHELRKHVQKLHTAASTCRHPKGAWVSVCVCVRVCQGLSSEGMEPLVPSKGSSTRCKGEHGPRRARSRCPEALQPHGLRGKDTCGSAACGGRCGRRKSGRAAGSVLAIARTPPKLPAGQAREPQTGRGTWLLAGLKLSLDGEERIMGTRKKAGRRGRARWELTAAPIGGSWKTQPTLTTQSSA